MWGGIILKNCDFTLVIEVLMKKSKLCVNNVLEKKVFGMWLMCGRNRGKYEGMWNMENVYVMKEIKEGKGSYGKISKELITKLVVLF